MDNKASITPKESYTVRKKPYRGMGFLLFCFLPLFLMNPEIGIIDIFPDFLGYGILLIALSKLRDVSERFEECRRKIRIAALISLGKLVALFLSFGVLSRGEGGAGSSQMMFSVVFCVLEFIYVIPALRSFFLAIHEVGLKYGCSYTYAERRRTLRKKGDNGETLVRLRSDRTTHITRSTTVFLAARSLLAMLPQLSITTSHGIDDKVFDFSKFHGLFNVLSVMVCIIFSLVWAFSVYRYLFGLLRQKDLKESLKEAFREAARTRPTRFIIRDVSFLASLISVAAFFGADLIVKTDRSSVNIIPDLIFAMLLIFSAMSLRELFHKSKGLRAVGIAVFSAYAAVSAAREYLRHSYFSEYTLFAYYKSPDAYSLYNSFSLVYVIDAVLLLSSVLILMKMVSAVEKGYAVSKLALESEATLRMTAAEGAEFRHSYILPVKITAVITAIITAISPFIMKLTSTTFGGVTDETMRLASFIVSLAATYWLVDFAASVVLACMIARTLNALKDRVETKLMLD